VLLVVVGLLIVAPAAAIAGENPLPFGKGAMPAWNQDSAPLPCGLTVGYVRMIDDMDVSNVAFVIGGQALPAGAVAVSHVTHHTNIFMARFDAWVLPFLNVYAFAGTTNGMAPGVRPVVAPIPGLPTVPTSLDVSYNGHLYGIGATAAAGYKALYATYDINREWVTLNLFDTNVPALSQGVRVGFRGKAAGRANATVYVGALHLSLRDAVLSGQDFIPGLPAGTFSLVARPKSAWNTLIGGSVEVSRHMVITAEAGVGTRKQLAIMPSVRF
jgi:hypothetical protein